MTLERGHAQMQYDAPLTQAQGQAILRKAMLSMFIWTVLSGIF